MGMRYRVFNDGFFYGFFLGREREEEEVCRIFGSGELLNKIFTLNRSHSGSGELFKKT
jgi:hypothetical protein